MRRASSRGCERRRSCPGETAHRGTIARRSSCSTQTLNEETFYHCDQLISGDGHVFMPAWTQQLRRPAAADGRAVLGIAEARARRRRFVGVAEPDADGWRRMLQVKRQLHGRGCWAAATTLEAVARELAAFYRDGLRQLVEQPLTCDAPDRRVGGVPAIVVTQRESPSRKANQIPALTCNVRGRMSRRRRHTDLPSWQAPLPPAACRSRWCRHVLGDAAAAETRQSGCQQPGRLQVLEESCCGSKQSSTCN